MSALLPCGIHETVGGLNDTADVHGCRYRGQSNAYVTASLAPATMVLNNAYFYRDTTNVSVKYQSRLANVEAVTYLMWCCIPGSRAEVAHVTRQGSPWQVRNAPHELRTADSTLHSRAHPTQATIHIPRTIAPLKSRIRHCAIQTPPRPCPTLSTPMQAPSASAAMKPS
jgi:hypothetical protein